MKNPDFQGSDSTVSQEGTDCSMGELASEWVEVKGLMWEKMKEES